MDRLDWATVFFDPGFFDPAFADTTAFVAEAVFGAVLACATLECVRRCADFLGADVLDDT